ncbi:MAG: hypothetical protein AAGJ28_00060 [Pseudomonadota bacterium]
MGSISIGLALDQGQGQVNAAAPPLLVVASVAPDLNMPLTAGSGLLRLQLLSPPAVSGDYWVQTDDLTAGPVGLKMPRIDEDPGSGLLRVAQPGLWAYDEAGSAPARSYRWQRNGADIPGASSPDYTPGAEDAGQTLTLIETATSAGASRSLTSNTLAIPAPAPLPDLFAVALEPGALLRLEANDGRDFTVDDPADVHDGTYHVEPAALAAGPVGLAAPVLSAETTLEAGATLAITPGLFAYDAALGSATVSYTTNATNAVDASTLAAPGLLIDTADAGQSITVTATVTQAGVMQAQSSNALAIPLPEPTPDLFTVTLDDATSTLEITGNDGRSFDVDDGADRYDGTYSIDPAALAAGPVVLVPPVLSGTPATGATLTLTPPLFAYDPEQGDLSISYSASGTNDLDETNPATPTLRVADNDIGTPLVVTATGTQPFDGMVDNLASRIPSGSVWDARDLPDGPVATLPDAIADLSLSALAPPTASGGVLSFDGSDDALQSEAPSLLNPTAGATHIRDYSLPDAEGGDTGQGFSIAGFARDADGTWWAANGGLNLDGSTAERRQSIVHLSADFSTNLGEIDIDGILSATLDVNDESPQGVAVDLVNDWLWVLDPSAQAIRAVRRDGTRVASADIPRGFDVGSVCMAESGDALWVMSRAAGNDATIQKISTDGSNAVLVNGTVSLNARHDHLFEYDGVLYVSCGTNGAQAFVAALDPVGLDRLGQADLPYPGNAAGLVGIEGIWIGPNGRCLVSHNGYFHYGDPADPVATNQFPRINVIVEYSLPTLASRDVDLFWLGSATPSGNDCAFQIGSPTDGTKIVPGLGFFINGGQGSIDIRKNTQTGSGGDVARVPASVSALSLVYAEIRGPDVTLYQNGVSIGTDTLGSNADGLFGLSDSRAQIGGSVVNDNRYAQMDWRAGGVIIGGARDRQLVEGALAWRHGQQALLPAGHPYAAAAPPPATVSASNALQIGSAPAADISVAALAVAVNSDGTNSPSFTLDLGAAGPGDRLFFLYGPFASGTPAATIAGQSASLLEDTISSGVAGSRLAAFEYLCDGAETSATSVQVTLGAGNDAHNLTAFLISNGTRDGTSADASTFAGPRILSTSVTPVSPENVVISACIGRPGIFGSHVWTGATQEAIANPSPVGKPAALATAIARNVPAAAHAVTLAPDGGATISDEAGLITVSYSKA